MTILPTSAIWFPLLLALWLQVPEQAALETCTRSAAVIWDVDADEALRVAWIESRHRRNPPRYGHEWSKAHPWRICGVYQVTGGRYGHLPCSLLVSSMCLASFDAVRAMAYWRRHCGRHWPCAWNQGWAGCRADCDFARKVRRRK